MSGNPNNTRGTRTNGNRANNTLPKALRAELNTILSLNADNAKSKRTESRLNLC